MNVFLSYSSRDRVTAAAIAESLSETGIAVWRDEEAIVPGSNVAYAVQQAIDESDGIVFLISKAWSDSSYSQTEVGAAVASKLRDNRKKIVPILIDAGATPPPFLRNYFYLDMTDPERREEGLSKLVRLLQDETPQPSMDAEHDATLRQIDSLELSLADREAMQETVVRNRERFARAIFVMSLLISGTLVTVALITGSVQTVGLFSGPLIGLLGAAIGFYFGRETSHDR